MDKKALRQEIIGKRSQLTEKEILEKSSKIKNRLFQLEEFKSANFIFSFISFGDEIHTHDIIKETLAMNKRVGVPISIDKPRKLLVSEIKDFNEELEIGYYNILAPKKEFERIVPPDLINLVLVPGLAFDSDGYRTGYGGGYYDRFFADANKNMVKIGLCFDLQIVSKVPRDIYDIPVDYIITEDRIIKTIISS
ncbi:MAG: 5-formyltetrahydrofolate cyclo-ligase [Tissierellia bacterium]|nr:5-formyltetrahydrofolate cyclo-ligase [Tissierellia bacterium]